MKTKLSLAVAVILLAITSSINAQTSAFTYQGSLNDNSTQANGSYQMRFSLFDQNTGGTQIGSAIEITNVQVENGIFTVKLDFGTDPFSFGSLRYLQVEVRRNAGETYVALAPRQQVATTPYSIRSLVSNISDNASQLGGVAANQYVQTNDPRLSDARTPTAGSGNYIQNTVTQQSGNFNVSGTGTSNILNAGTQFNLSGNRILSAPGTNNTFVGIGNGTNITSGFGNTFVGKNTGSNTTTGNRNTFVGSGAGFENISGSDNSFFGFNAGLRVTTGVQNSLFGVSAGSGNLVGNDNSFFGYDAGLLATGSQNSFFGRYAGRNTSSGNANSFFGRNAGENNSTGAENAFFGSVTGNNNNSGASNSFFGSRAGFGNTTGSGNSFIGYNSGTANVSGSNNTVIGTNANVGANNLTFATSIGAGSVVNASSTIALGRSNGSDVVSIPGNVQMSGTNGIRWQSGNNAIAIGDCGGDGFPKIRLTQFATTQDLCDAGGIAGFNRDIQINAVGDGSVIIFGGGGGSPGIRVTPDNYVSVKLAFGGSFELCTLQVPVPGGAVVDAISRCSSSRRYKTNIADFNDGKNILERLRPVSFNWKNDGRLDLGLVAEEVEEIEPLLVTYNEEGKVEGVKYDRIGVVLINVVKQQQTQIETQTEENKQLRSKIETLENKLDEQKRQFENLRLLVCADKPEAEICRRENVETKSETENQE